MINTFLSQNISSITRIDSTQEKALQKLNLFSVKDILYHLPARYDHVSSAKLVRDLQNGEQVTVYGKIRNLKTGKSFKSKVSKAEGVLDDDTGKLKVLWFHQPYIAKIIQTDSLVKVYGKVTEKNGVLSMLNPHIETVSEIPQNIGNTLFRESLENKTSRTHTAIKNSTDAADFEEFTGQNLPIYNESKGITSRWFYSTIQRIFKTREFSEIEDLIPAEILKRYNLPSLTTALIWVHTPKKDTDAEVARKRFAFEEIFHIQLQNELQRATYRSEKAFEIDVLPTLVESFINRFPFPLTESQARSTGDIFSDFKKGYPMSRLLEGDVGSGKTAVAAITAYAAISTRPKGQNFGTLQVAYMAPTEILAKQHFESFITYFSHLPVSVGLITGNGCRKFPSKINPTGWTDISRTQFLKWVKSGEIAIVIGTHALIQKSVEFKHLAYVIIDEQHRFGTAQRQKLMKKQKLVPHLLSMTATPIPRTLALTIYGDLDLSLLDQMPLGRKKVITKIVHDSERKATYETIRKELLAGRQVYVICPRINEPDPDKEAVLNTKSVKAEAKRLAKDVFQEYRIDIMHSKMKPADKDKVMDTFSKHKIDILVSTSVVEVGVNVPNASVIVIEGGERFGLSQLHQLRGRVIRGTHQPYCYVFTSDTSAKRSDTTIERLHALEHAKNGFELSELDLKLRGTGDLYGNKQWGISDIAMDAIKNIKMVEAARKEARVLIEESPTLEFLSKKYPLLSASVTTKREVHFE
jgi:ATP-dependent DNA helicase RecG